MVHPGPTHWKGHGPQPDRARPSLAPVGAGLGLGVAVCKGAPLLGPVVAAYLWSGGLVGQARLRLWPPSQGSRPNLTSSWLCLYCGA